MGGCPPSAAPKRSPTPSLRIRPASVSSSVKRPSPAAPSSPSTPKTKLNSLASPSPSRPASTPAVPSSPRRLVASKCPSAPPLASASTAASSLPTRKSEKNKNKLKKKERSIFTLCFFIYSHCAEIVTVFHKRDVSHSLKKAIFYIYLIISICIVASLHPKCD